MAEGDWSESKAWIRATRERIGMTQHDVAVLANLTVDMVKKYESEKYRIQPSDRMKDMLEAEGVAVDYTYLPEETD